VAAAGLFGPAAAELGLLAQELRVQEGEARGRHRQPGGGVGHLLPSRSE
jgi:hypothetical protein